MTSTAPMLGRQASIRRDHWRDQNPGRVQLGDSSVGRRAAKRRETADWRREAARYLAAKGLPR